MESGRDEKIHHQRFLHYSLAAADDQQKLSKWTLENLHFLSLRRFSIEFFHPARNRKTTILILFSFVKFEYSIFVGGCEWKTIYLSGISVQEGWKKWTENFVKMKNQWKKLRTIVILEWCNKTMKSSSNRWESLCVRLQNVLSSRQLVWLILMSTRRQ